MNGQFKTKGFDKEQLKDFSSDLKRQGLLFDIRWKKNHKIVKETSDKANVLLLEIEGKWFFKQIGNKGFIRLKYLDDQQKKILLKVLGEYHFYSEPKWELAIAMVIFYLVVEYYISAAQQMDWLMPFIMVCTLLVLLFLWVAYLRAQEKLSEKMYKLSMIFGLPAYALTAIGSLLALPLYNCILRYHLKFKILNNSTI